MKTRQSFRMSNPHLGPMHLFCTVHMLQHKPHLLRARWVCWSVRARTLWNVSVTCTQPAATHIDPHYYCCFHVQINLFSGVIIYKGRSAESIKILSIHAHACITRGDVCGGTAFPADGTARRRERWHILKWM